MGDSILVAFITGGLTLAGTIITVLSTSKKANTDMKVAQAVTDQKIEELTREVREHNNFARRMPVVESKVEGIERRLDKLERTNDE